MKKTFVSVLAFVFVLVMFAAAQTYVAPSQIRTGPNTGIWISSAARGFTLARLGSMFVLDESDPQQLPLLTVTVPPPPTAPAWKKLTVTITTPSSTQNLGASPANDALLVFRNGLLQTEGVDYDYAAGVVTFRAASALQTGDLAVYRWQQ